MHLFDQINPSSGQLEALIDNYPDDTPICMLNIIKFKAHIESEDMSGEQLYKRYMHNVMPFLKKAGGRLIWKGHVNFTFIGDQNNQADIVFIVRYPSVNHFKSMIIDPGYLNIATDRTMALEYGGLIALEEDYWDGR